MLHSLMSVIPMLLPLACVDTGAVGESPADSGDSFDGGGGSSSVLVSPECSDYLACLSDAGSEGYSDALEQYGNDSPCWANTTGADACSQACLAALGDQVEESPTVNACWARGAPSPSALFDEIGHDWPISESVGDEECSYLVGGWLRFQTDLGSSFGALLMLPAAPPYAYLLASYDGCTLDDDRTLDRCRNPSGSDELAGSFAATWDRLDAQIESPVSNACTITAHPGSAM